MSVSSDLDEPYEDSGSKFIPDSSDDDSEDSFSDFSESEEEEPITFGDFSVVADPFMVCLLIYILLFIHVGRILGQKAYTTETCNTAFCWNSSSC